MIDIWFGLTILLLLLALVFLLPAMRTARGGSDDSKRTAIIELYRARTSELHDALDREAMGEKQVAQLEAEMARELLAAGSGAPAAGPSRRGAGLLIGLALLVPLMAAGAYVWSERPGEVAFYREVVASHQGGGDAATVARITRQLKDWVQKHPEDLRSRYVLAQRLLVAGDIAGAVSAYRFVVEREPQAASVKAELAQALFFAGGSKITEEIRLLVKQVLESQPTDGTALGLAGIAAYEDKDYRQARDHWQSALQQLEHGSAAAEALAAGVARAEQALAEHSKTALEPASSVALGGAAIRVQVSLSGEIAADSATPVYIYARSTDSPLPLAIVRLSAGQLPVEVVLDESRAMMPGRSIASVDSVQLVARLALHGDARPVAGDWQGTIESLSRENWGKAQSITIDREL
ncbi:c-type cytochrome biogenesis protein CcmI [Microbulbifer sp. 2304DJ12-6]|uniref:c-type cytochrome biogenesis protein CcmI n=1 Tax=Microbulbifer sp. 2304DJ12-6 TaxID=3233340 RepID=UPI0039B03A70